MTALICKKCQHDLGGPVLKGKCPKCGTSFKAKLSSKIIIFGSIFFGFMFGPIVVTPMAAQNGISPQSITGIIVGVLGSATSVLVLGTLSLRALKHEWGGGK